MATLDTSSDRQLNNTVDSTQIYEANAEILYGIFRFFLTETAANAALEELARELHQVLPRAGYKRYATLLCLRLAYEQLKNNPLVKVPKELNLAGRSDSPADLDFEEALCLLLRDRFALSCFEISTAAHSSEGAIRTRLERSRHKLFPSAVSRAGGADRSQHTCICARDQIEDWNLTNPRLGQFTAPPQAIRAVGTCIRCDSVLQQRLASLSLFRELPGYTTPEKLKSFPVTPVFVKEGRKFLLNWAAAPWYTKALFEGMLATTLVLGIVLSIPRIKGIYEFWLEKRLDLYSLAELATGLGSSRSDTLVDNNSASATASQMTTTTADSNSDTSSQSVPTTAQQPPGTAPHAKNTTELAIKAETEFAGRESEVASSEKVYRVLIKTDSPETIKEQVLKALTNVQYIPADEDAPHGSELPGGVMFDAFVPLKSYKQLVNELIRLGETKVIITRAKERGQPGKARLKIWLQRI